MNSPIYLAADVLSQGFFSGIYKTTIALLLELAKRHQVILYSAQGVPPHFLQIPNVSYATLPELNKAPLLPNSVCLLPCNGLFSLNETTRYFSLYRFYGKCAIVSIIYDTIYDVFQVPTVDSHYWVQESVRVANAIITPSLCSTQDLNKYYQVGDVEVHTVYLGTTIQPQPRNPGNAFVYIGGFNYRKGVDILIKSLIHLLHQNRNVMVKLVGHTPDANLMNLINLAQATGLAEFIEIVDEKGLAELYSVSKALVYPSLYEGFGLPVLEAMRCKCPVIACNTSSIPEVGGSHILYTRPKDEIDLANKILAIENGKIDVEQLTQDAYKHSLQFDWTKTGLEYTRILNKAGESTFT